MKPKHSTRLDLLVAGPDLLNQQHYLLFSCFSQKQNKREKDLFLPLDVLLKYFENQLVWTWAPYG